jgi:hypothetical protein
MGIADRTLCNGQDRRGLRRCAPALTVVDCRTDPQRCFTESGGIQTPRSAV